MDISVVIPARNRETKLPYCLESVISQTLPPREIIVVDDRSTDGTRAVVESYAKHGVRYERLPEGRGAQAARNHGIRSARCDWIAFQDSDDRWLPTKLEKQVGALKANGSSDRLVVITNGRIVFTDGTRSAPLIEWGFHGNCHRKLLLRSGPMFPTMLVSKRALDDIGLLDEDCPSYQEWDTAIRLSERCGFLHLDECLFEWVAHNDESISKDPARDLAGHEYVMRKHRAAIIDAHGPVAWRMAVAGLVARALAFGAFDQAERLAASELPALARSLTSALVRRHKSPRRAGTLLKVAAAIPLGATR
nr:glycosyltransferase family 2 protein [Ramlibacter lithotrophicus]